LFSPCLNGNLDKIGARSDRVYATVQEIAPFLELIPINPQHVSDLIGAYGHLLSPSFSSVGAKSNLNLFGRRPGPAPSQRIWVPILDKNDPALNLQVGFADVLCTLGNGWRLEERPASQTSNLHDTGAGTIQTMNLELTEKDYQNFREFIYQKSGINLHEGKKELLKARLMKYLRHSGFRSIGEYYSYLVKHDETGQECVNLLDTVSTNLTYFFREPKHFQFLNEVAFPDLEKRLHGKPKKKITLWSAGCSSGEEPYSLAMTCLEKPWTFQGLEVHILATDISTKMLAKASEGIYPEDRLENVSYEVKRRYFQRGAGRWKGYYRVKSVLQQLIRFGRLNLVDRFPENEGLDIIFCRNVMIYFDKPTQERIVQKFHHALNEKGYLFIGHSESLTGVNHSFKYIQPSVYRK
jgi:chemotaxis protein methyltransferase CheR